MNMSKVLYDHPIVSVDVVDEEGAALDVLVTVQTLEAGRVERTEQTVLKVPDRAVLGDIALQLLALTPAAGATVYVPQRSAPKARPYNPTAKGAIERRLSSKNRYRFSSKAPAEAAQEAVNMPGRQLDVLVKMPDGTLQRPVAILTVDEDSGLILGCRLEVPAC